MKLIKLRAIAGVFAASLIAVGVNSHADESHDYAALMEKHQAALVTVKYILATNMGRNMETENESELSCVMVSSDGLLICPNNQMTGFIGLMKQMAGQAGSQMSATPKNMKVIVGEQSESLDAEILARDSELDMAWLKVTNNDGQSFAYVDFEQGVEAGIGEPVYTIRRTGDNFGRTAIASQSRIGGIASKPRKLYIPDVPVVLGTGLPVFNASGNVIGLLVTQIPEPSDSSGNAFNIMSNMRNIQDAMSGLILPAAQVAKATKQALSEG